MNYDDELESGASSVQLTHRNRSSKRSESTHDSTSKNDKKAKTIYDKTVVGLLEAYVENEVNSKGCHPFQWSWYKANSTLFFTLFVVCAALATSAYTQKQLDDATKDATEIRTLLSQMREEQKAINELLASIADLKPAIEDAKGTLSTLQVEKNASIIVTNELNMTKIGAVESLKELNNTIATSMFNQQLNTINELKTLNSTFSSNINRQKDQTINEISSLNVSITNSILTKADSITTSLTSFNETITDDVVSTANKAKNEMNQRSIEVQQELNLTNDKWISFDTKYNSYLSGNVSLLNEVQANVTNLSQTVLKNVAVISTTCGNGIASCQIDCGSDRVCIAGGCTSNSVPKPKIEQFLMGTSTFQCYYGSIDAGVSITTYAVCVDKVNVATT